MDLLRAAAGLAPEEIRRRGIEFTQIRSNEFAKDRSTYALSKALRNCSPSCSGLSRPLLSSPSSFNPRPAWRSWDTPSLGSLLSMACSRSGKNSQESHLGGRVIRRGRPLHQKKRPEAGAGREDWRRSVFLGGDRVPANVSLFLTPS